MSGPRRRLRGPADAAHAKVEEHSGDPLAEEDLGVVGNGPRGLELDEFGRDAQLVRLQRLQVASEEKTKVKSGKLQAAS